MEPSAHTDTNVNENDNIYIIEDGKKIYPVFNNTNFLVSINEINNILKEGGLNEKINDIKIWQQAFIHKSMFKGSDFNKNKKYFGNLDGIKLS